MLIMELLHKIFNYIGEYNFDHRPHIANIVIVHPDDMEALKEHFNHKLLSAVGRDHNNNWFIHGLAVIVSYNVKAGDPIVAHKQQQS